MWWADYIGAPFIDRGRGRGGYDCWGLVRAIYERELGLSLPSFGEISADDLLRVARRMGAYAADPCWIAVDDPRPFDVVLMRGAGVSTACVHVGLVAGGGALLHTEPATGAVLVNASHFSVARRIIGLRRHVNGVQA